MKSTIFHFLLAANLTRFPYPQARRDETCEEEYHGVKVKDPYRWLEDLNSTETKEFISVQNTLTNGFLESNSNRAELKRNYSKFKSNFVNGIPIPVGNRYFFKENSGIYSRDSLTSDAELLFDPLHPNDSLGEFTFSPNGEILAYTLSRDGSDWKTVHFKEVRTRQDLPDVLNYTKWPDMAWTHDNAGIFYVRCPVVNDKVLSSNNKVYYHRLNTKQQEDILVEEFPAQPSWSISVEVSHCGKYLLISVEDNFYANAVYIAQLTSPIRKGFQKNVVPLFPSVTEAAYKYISNNNSLFYFITTKHANNGRIIEIDVTTYLKLKDDSKKEDKSSTFEVVEIIPQSNNKVVEWAILIMPCQFIVCYTQEVKTTLEYIDTRNLRIKTIYPLSPVKITHSGVSSSSYNKTEFFFRTESFLNPGTIYRCDTRRDEFNCTVYAQDEINGFDLNNITVRQVFFLSKDNTAVPMFIVHNEKFALNGKSPSILTAYGGFKHNTLPEFSLRRLFFVKNFKGVFAVVNVRGGGEFGVNWHLDGSHFKKQNTFDDFISAAEYLITKRYTNRSVLAVEGFSNGGLTVAASINQRPELFGAAIIEAGILDLLRFQNFTEGYTWCSDYGCSENEEDFKNLRTFSPLHNIKVPRNSTWQYPAVLVVTVKNDDQMVPSHSYKYIAQIQNTIGSYPGQNNPLLLRVHKHGGHDARTLDNSIDNLLFLMESMGLELKKPRLQAIRNYADAIILSMFLIKSLTVMHIALYAIPLTTTY